MDSKNVDAIYVKDALSVHAYDNDIWEFAKKKGMTILTKDNDFDELSQLYGCPPKVIHLLCGNKSIRFISALITRSKNEIVQFVEKDPNNCLLKIG
ncbi:DUF5615 family PIN-like protein [Gracilimonas sp.]|uniref:DUF5615 family PIN-like protein n=1 Tax=Gracilimonas sp. TaxID=1974203 RepID=UPI003752E1A6